MNAHDVARDRVRDAGLRATPSRVATLALMVEARRPLSHGEVVDALRAAHCPEGPVFQRTTVFRNLVDLTDAGLLSRRDLGDRTWRFEVAAADPHHHAHFICVECGDITCLDGVEVHVSENGAAAPAAVHAQAIDVHLRGYCDDCVSS